MIEDYIGKPFVDGGRGPDEYDCWGLVKDFYCRELGIELPDYHISAFKVGLVTETMRRDLKADWTKRMGPQFGDLVAISMDMALPRYIVNHVGVYVGYNKFLHTRKATGAVIERTDDFKWDNRIEGYYFYGAV